MPSIKNKQQIGTTVNVTAGQTKNSDVVDIEHITRYALEIKLTKVSAVVGNFNLQASLDEVIWYDIDSSDVSFSDSIDQLYNVTEAYYKFVRVKFVNTSGEFNVTTNIMKLYKEG